MAFKRARFALLLMLTVTLGLALLAACGPGKSAEVADAPDQSIAQAVRDYLTEQGAAADLVEVEVDLIDGDFARVTIISTDPDAPGGYTGFLKRQAGTWSTLIVGSGFNPVELKNLGIPQAVLPNGWILPTEEPEKAEAPPAGTAAGSVDCAAQSEGMLVLADEEAGYCLLYPTSHVVERLESGDTEIVVGSIMNHIDPRVIITVEDLAGRSLDQVVADFLTGYEGFEIAQTAMTVDGAEAVLLDGIPGQDFYRKVLVANGTSLYQFTFAPYDSTAPDSFSQAESLYVQVMDSLQLATP